MPEISLDEQIKCVRRELKLRQTVYPRWVSSGKLKQATADHELAAMQKVHDTLMVFNKLQMPVEQIRRAAEILREEAACLKESYGTWHELGWPDADDADRKAHADHDEMIAVAAKLAEFAESRAP